MIRDHADQVRAWPALVLRACTAQEERVLNDAGDARVCDGLGDMPGGVREKVGEHGVTPAAVVCQRIRARIDEEGSQFGPVTGRKTSLLQRKTGRSECLARSGKVELMLHDTARGDVIAWCSWRIADDDDANGILLAAR